MRFLRGFFLLVLICTSSCTRPGQAGLLIDPTPTPASTQPQKTGITATGTQTLTPTATFTPLPTLTPTPDIPRVAITATVWITDTLVPILTYHQFAPDNADVSTALKMRLSDFRLQMQSLYDNGYALVSLEKWLNGDLVTPPGRRPLVISMDDLYYNNQLSLTSSGEPDPATGIGVLWQFYQEHPDFGFHLTLFASLGEKLYGNPDDPHWQDDLANAIAWGIDHDAMPYNHFYTHPLLNLTAPKDITWEAQMNDAYLRKLLERIGREDLVSRLGNMLALPFGEWPTSQAGIKALTSYLDPEGKPVQAILEIDYIVRPKFLLPPYSLKFDRYHVPRIVATQSAIDYLVEHKQTFPQAQVCSLGSLEVSKVADPDFLTKRIAALTQEGKCPYGIYVLQGFIFNVKPTEVTKLFP